jgi:TonB family protein
VAGVLCIAQVGLILLFSEHDHGPVRLSPAPGHFRLIGPPLTAGQLTRTFFAIDPTVFSLPNRHGFSERAWLRLPAQQFDVPGETEAPAWLTNDAARLGTDIPPLNPARSALLSDLADQGSPEPEPWPVFLTPEHLRSQSLVEIQGELAGRRINAPTEMPAVTNSQLLSNSVVQIAVDSAGQVIATRLLGRSGSTDADGNALDQARRLRFRPAPSPAPVWGRAVFEWQTAEPVKAGHPAGAP